MSKTDEIDGRSESKELRDDIESKAFELPATNKENAAATPYRAARYQFEFRKLMKRDYFAEATIVECWCVFACLIESKMAALAKQQEETSNK